MAKFYISSGDFRCTIDGKNPKSAAVAAFETLKNNPVPTLSKLTVASEHGFDSQAEDDIYFCTIDLLEESGQVSEYYSAEWVDLDNTE